MNDDLDFNPDSVAKTLEEHREQYRGWLNAKGYADPFKAIEAAAFRAGLPELAQEVIAERLKVKVGSPRAFAPYLAA